MNTNTPDIREVLAEADKHLAAMAVTGENVFHICDARRLLRMAFDEACAQAAAREEKKEEVDGG